MKATKSDSAATNNSRFSEEWPTLLTLIGCYACYGGITMFAADLGLWIAIPATSLVLVLHSSLQHEILHGHPSANRRLNEALVFPALGLFIPFARFRDTHLAHHRNACLTDPYDDPESNYLDPVVWETLPRWQQSFYRFNNTLLGRMLVGPAISLASFYRDDVKSIWAGERAILSAYLLHLAGLASVAAWHFSISSLPLWAYGLAAYAGLSVLKIRTFLEHRAHERIGARSVIVDDGGPLAFLFLNNNYHAVHHAYPQRVWHQLPALYRSRKSEFLKRNGDYAYGSYAEIFGLYFLKRKDRIPHPLMDKGGWITNGQGKRPARTAAFDTHDT